MDISQHPKPPKKPLTPYMRYSKEIWPTVKAMNSTMSVCEIGATIGRMWRELTDGEKQKYNEEFIQAKADYEVEIQAYLKMTGLTASDLNKSKKSKKVANNANKAVAGNTAPPGYPAAANTAALMQAGQFNSAAGALPHFQQIWTTQQYQQAVMLAAQQQQAGGNTQDSGTAAAMAMFYAQQQAQAAAATTESTATQQATAAGQAASSQGATTAGVATTQDGQQTWNWHQNTNTGAAATNNAAQSGFAQGQQQLVQPQQLNAAAFPEAQAVRTSPEMNGAGESGNDTDANKAPSTTANSSSAHNTYNSYQHYPWGSTDNTATSNDASGISKVFPNDKNQEREMNHLKTALSEKTKEVQRLQQELDKAHRTIDAMRQAGATDNASPHEQQQQV